MPEDRERGSPFMQDYVVTSSMRFRRSCGEFKIRACLRRYTWLTIEIRNSGLMDSSVCGYRGEALFDQRLIPLGFARSFAAGRGQEIAKVGAMSVTRFFTNHRSAVHF
jgi:hypothetical protein